MTKEVQITMSLSSLIYTQGALQMAIERTQAFRDDSAAKERPLDVIDFALKEYWNALREVNKVLEANT